MRFPSLPQRNRIIWTILVVAFLVLPLLTFRMRRSLPAPVGTRSLEVAFLAPSGDGLEIMRTRSGLSQVDALTNTGGSVIAFSVAADGSHVFYSAANPVGGSDLWQVDRDGQGVKKLLDCGAARCDAVFPSPDGTRLAYTHDVSSSTQQVRIYSLENGALSDWYAPVSAEDAGLSWSPDSTRLAINNPADRLTVLDVATGAELHAVDAQLIGAPAWSPDSNQLAYSSEEQVGGFAEARLYIFDLTSGETRRLITGPDGVDISPPQWSPDGAWLLIGQRTLPGSPAKQLFMIRVDGSNYETIVEDFTATHTAYRWSPDGQRVVFQQFALGDSQNRPEIWLWQRADVSLKRIATDASQPQWLP